MNAHLSKQELLEKIVELEAHRIRQALIIQNLIGNLLEAQQKLRDNTRLINRLLELVDKWEPDECPDCEEETLVHNLLNDGQSHGADRICYNCGYEREE